MNEAVRIVGQIEAGDASSTIHIGSTSFLGIEDQASSLALDSNRTAGSRLYRP